MLENYVPQKQLFRDILSELNSQHINLSTMKLNRHVFGSLSSVAVAPDLTCVLSIFSVWGVVGGMIFHYFSG